MEVLPPLPSEIIQPGPVLDFLVANQSVGDPHGIDWAKAGKILKNLTISARPSNMKYRITGLSDLPCNRQLFSLKQRTNGNTEGEFQTTEVTVYDYFVNYCRIHLRVSGDFPCIDVGKPKRPNYIPLELCSVVTLHQHTKALSSIQKSSFLQKLTQKPQEVLSDVIATKNYGVDASLRAAGDPISSSFAEIEGRVLSTPKLKLVYDEDFSPQNSRRNYDLKKLVQPMEIGRWAIVNFSVHCDIKKIWTDLARCGQQKGIYVEDPFVVIEENPQARRETPLARVELMFEQIKTELSQIPRFLLCLLPERKASTIYGPWKRKTLADCIVTQCISPVKVNDQYLANVLLKINAKLAGLTPLAVEQSSSMPRISKSPTMILGMDACHTSAWQIGVPSVAAGKGPLALKGTAIALVILNGCIWGVSDARGRIDLIYIKKLEAERKKKEGTTDLEGKEEDHDEGDQDEEAGIIISGNSKKILSLGKSLVVAIAGAVADFNVVWTKLEAVCKKNADISLQEALEICCASIQEILIKDDFRADVSFGGFDEEGKPRIVTLEALERGVIVSDMKKVVSKPMECVVLGSGSNTLLSYTKFSNVKDPNDTQLVINTLMKAIVAGSLLDPLIGGFFMVANLSPLKGTNFVCEEHILSFLPKHYEDFKYLLDTCLIYISRGQQYSESFERKVVSSFYKPLEAELGSDYVFGWSHVLGVILKTEESKMKDTIVGLMAFDTEISMIKAYECIHTTMDLDKAHVEVYKASKGIMRSIGEMFSPSVDKRCNFF